MRRAMIGVSAKEFESRGIEPNFYGNDSEELVIATSKLGLIGGPKRLIYQEMRIIVHCSLRMLLPSAASA